MIKWSDIKLGVSPISNSIYIGKSKPVRPGVNMWTDRSGDMTEQVIYAVFEWFLATGYKDCYYNVNGKLCWLTFEIGCEDKEITNETV